MIEIPQFTAAAINDRGGLLISTPVIIDQLSMEMGPDVYYAYDYDFFYSNLVENVAIRCQAWQQ